MSRVKLEAIWQHEKVLPYILTTLKGKIDDITAVEKIFLFGSRGRVPFEEWDTLEGKDWDVLVQAGYRLKNAGIVVDKDYHLDLLVMDKEQVQMFTQNMTIKELFPINELEGVMIKNSEDGNI